MPAGRCQRRTAAGWRSTARASPAARRTSAQEMTCQPPSVRDSLRLRRNPARRRRWRQASTHRRPARRPALASRRSRRPARVPSAENSQKAGFRPLAAAQHTEDRGRERKQADEDDRVSRRRILQGSSAVSSGNPTTTPSAVMRSDVRSARDGRFSLNSSSRPSPSSPAIAARAAVRNSGSNSRTATLVAGSDALKITTPMSPLTHPLAVRSMWASKTVIRRRTRRFDAAGC